MSATAVAGRPTLWARVTYSARALDDRNMRLLMLAQLTSIGGYWCFYVAQSWLALELTDSPGLVGLIAPATLAPYLLFSIPAGILADRVDLRKLMFSARLLVASSFALEALLAATGLLQPWQMFAIAFVTGIGVCVDNPVQYRLMADFAGPERVSSAAALASMVFQLSAVVGPLLGGLLLGAFGPAVGMGAGAVGNVMLLACYLAMRVPKNPPGEKTTLREALGGVGFIFTNTKVGLATLTWAVAILVILPYQALMSVFVRDELALGAFELGSLLTAAAVGAFLGSIAAGYDRVFRPTVGTAIASLAAAGAALTATAWTAGFGQALAALVAVGVAWGFVYVITTAVVLTATPLSLRGRVLGAYLLMWGLQPLGSFGAGLVAGESNTRVALALSGQGVIAVAVALLAIVLLARALRR